MQCLCEALRLSGSTYLTLSNSQIQPSSTSRFDFLFGLFFLKSPKIFSFREIEFRQENILYIFSCRLHVRCITIYMLEFQLQNGSKASEYAGGIGDFCVVHLSI